MLRNLLQAMLNHIYSTKGTPSSPAFRIQNDALEDGKLTDAPLQQIMNDDQHAVRDTAIEDRNILWKVHEDRPKVVNSVRERRVSQVDVTCTNLYTFPSHSKAVRSEYPPPFGLDKGPGGRAIFREPRHSSTEPDGRRFPLSMGSVLCGRQDAERSFDARTWH